MFDFSVSKPYTVPMNKTTIKLMCEKLRYLQQFPSGKGRTMCAIHFQQMVKLGIRPNQDKE